MKQHIVNTICALVIVAGIIIASTDAIVALFDCIRFWQYLFNFAFICLVAPACIAASDLPRRMHPEYYGGHRQ